MTAGTQGTFLPNTLLHAPKKLTKRQQRRAERQRREEHRRRVEAQAEYLLLWEVLMAHPDTEEQHVVNVDGSGPPSSWRRRLEGLIRDAMLERGMQWGEAPNNLTLLRRGVRLGWAPRSILKPLLPGGLERRRLHQEVGG